MTLVLPPSAAQNKEDMVKDYVALGEWWNRWMEEVWVHKKHRAAELLPFPLCPQIAMGVRKPFVVLSYRGLKVDFYVCFLLLFVFLQQLIHSN